MLFDVVKCKLSKENMVITHDLFYAHMSIRESSTAMFLWLVSALAVPDWGTCPWTMQQHVVGVQLSCQTFSNPMDCSMPGSPVLHYLSDSAQIHVH